MTKAAFAAWGGRIAPIFDAARQIHLVESIAGKLLHDEQDLPPEDLPVPKALRLAELGVETLVCGAISRPLRDLVAAYGIQVVPFVAGDLHEVIRAWLNGSLNRPAFAMPGCCGGGRGRFRGRRYQGTREESTMDEKRRGGMGQGIGRGKGPGGQRRGRMAGPMAAGPGGHCVCPQCGRKEPHVRGEPCVDRRCPECGVAMTRE